MCERVDETQSGLCRLQPLYLKAQLGCTLGFWLVRNTQRTLLNKWQNVKSDPNHMCVELQTVFWGILTQILRFTLSHRSGVHNTIQSSSISAASEAETARPLSNILAFGSLGRRLLWFLSAPRSHRRRAGLPLTAPFGPSCRRRRLAPRPAGGGKTRSKCQSICPRVMFMLNIWLCGKSGATFSMCRNTGACSHRLWIKRKNYAGNRFENRRK